MLFPRTPFKRSNTVAFITQARHWAGRVVLFLAGLGLLFVSPSHHDHRRWEVIAGVILLAGALGDLLLGILLAVAARNVKPRKLGLD
jgi:protein-S-isoprenylcysteine O-methyltransferase Ste14